MTSVDLIHRPGRGSRRHWLARLLALIFAPSPWVAAYAAQTATRTYDVSGFDALGWRATGELRIEQTGREHLSVDAEPVVLDHLVIEVRQRRLWIGFAPGRAQTQQPIRFTLEVKSLVALDASGSGNIRIGALTAPTLALALDGSDDLHLTRLNARTLDVRLTGSGSVGIDAGGVEAQRIAIAGSGAYTAPQLASRHAEVAIDGSGDAQLAVSARLSAHLSGSGSVSYRGDAEVTSDVTGSGIVQRAAR
jgi:hypothetical protein